MRHSTDSSYAHRVMLKQALDYGIVLVTLSGAFEYHNDFGAEQHISLEMAS